MPSVANRDLNPAPKWGLDKGRRKATPPSVNGANKVLTHRKTVGSWRKAKTTTSWFGAARSTWFPLSHLMPTIASRLTYCVDMAQLLLATTTRAYYGSRTKHVLALFSNSIAIYSRNTANSTVGIQQHRIRKKLKVTVNKLVCLQDLSVVRTRLKQHPFC